MTGADSGDIPYLNTSAAERTIWRNRHDTYRSDVADALSVRRWGRNEPEPLFKLGLREAL